MQAALSDVVRLQYPDLDAFIDSQAAILRPVVGAGRARPAVVYGCGSGVHVEALRRLGFEAWGVDRDPAMLTMARADFPACAFVEGEVIGHGGRYDLVAPLVNHATYHADLSVLTAQAAANLTPGGRLLFSIENFARLRATGRTVTPPHTITMTDGRTITLRERRVRRGRTYRLEQKYEIAGGETLEIALDFTPHLPAEIAAALEAAGFRVEITPIYDRGCLLIGGTQ